MVIACREKGWFDEKTDFRIWDHLCRSMGVEFQLTTDFQGALIPIGHKIVVLDESGGQTLQSFVHPDKAVYLFGRSGGNRIQDRIAADYVVRVDMPAYKDVSCFGISIASMVLYDRMVKNGNTGS